MNNAASPLRQDFTVPRTGGPVRHAMVPVAAVSLWAGCTAGLVTAVATVLTYLPVAQPFDEHLFLRQAGLPTTPDTVIAAEIVAVLLIAALTLLTRFLSRRGDTVLQVFTAILGAAVAFHGFAHGSDALVELAHWQASAAAERTWQWWRMAAGICQAAAAGLGTLLILQAPPTRWFNANDHAKRLRAGRRW